MEQQIFTAVWKGNLNSLKTLVDKSNIECKDPEHQRTPLLWSCFYGNKTITPFLVETGANIEAKDKVGNLSNITAPTSHEIFISMVEPLCLQLLTEGINQLFNCWWRRERTSSAPTRYRIS